ncbi:dephospho-CoA kinase [uncultured Fusobacterium sp.]|uniref:dephospho-CoA kinase n=1 Tax=uncultured Fusobacterium sp. TaxID=159267 RepID=UPI0025EAD961|nr:dephospho-CoA kinase [uncultured Fusobacterium sp.]MCF2639689.1 dephospho-CoA kinase [Fusobacterium varium]
MIVGLTGGIASGKSTVSNYFREFGAEVLDADVVAKELSEKEENVAKIIEIFGNEILDENGNISRKKMRERAFLEKDKLKQLNELLHPQVIEVFKNKKENTKEDEIVIFDIPLLFEAGMENLCDTVIVVYISKRVQLERMMKRDRHGIDLAERIIESQMSMSDKIDKADIIINNNCTLEDLKNNVNVVYYNLQKK